METAPTRVLLVEESRMDARLIALYLGESTTTHFSITAVERLHEALDRLKREPFEVVLCDLSLPDSHGLETFEAGRDIPENIVTVDGQNYSVYIGERVSLAHQSQVHGPVRIGMIPSSECSP